MRQMKNGICYKSCLWINRFIFARTGILLTKLNDFPVMKQIWKERNCENGFVLRTMSRSGSHYAMNILANYVAFNFFGVKDPLDFIDIKERFWHPIYHRNALYSPEELFTKTGFSSFKWVHVEHDLTFPERQYYRKNPKIIINTYRNPLDQKISQHFYNETRESGKGLLPTDDLENFMNEYFVNVYKTVKELAQRKNVKNVAYENLINEPFRTVKEILLFSNISFCEDNLIKAIEASQKEKIWQAEKKLGVKDLYKYTAKDYSRVRSGVNGEWEKYFTDDHVKIIEKILQKEGLSLSEFVFEKKNVS